MFDRLPERPNTLNNLITYAIVGVAALLLGSVLVAGIAKIVSSLKREIGHSVDSFARSFSMGDLTNVDNLIYFGLWLIFALIVIKVVPAVVARLRR